MLLKALLPGDLGQKLYTPDTVTAYERAMVHEVIRVGETTSDVIRPGMHALVLRNALDKGDAEGKYVFCEDVDIYAAWSPRVYDDNTDQVGSEEE